MKTKTKMKTKKTAKNTGNPWLLIAGVAVIMVTGLAWILYLIANPVPKKYSIEKPVKKIVLPAGVTMKNPEGFPAFRSDRNGILAYSFVKYEGEWKNNNFIRIDLTALPLKKMGIKRDAGAGEIEALIFRQKQDNKAATGGSDERAQSYVIDYSRFREQGSGTAIISKKTWKMLEFEAYDPLPGKNLLVRLWKNRYTVHKDYAFVFDYVCDAGTLKGEVKNTDDYAASLKSIENDIFIMIGMMTFK